MSCAEYSVVFGDGEVVEEGWLTNGEDGNVSELVAVLVEPKVGDEWRDGAVKEGEELAGGRIFLGMSGHAHEEFAGEVFTAENGDVAIGGGKVEGVRCWRMI